MSAVGAILKKNKLDFLIILILLVATGFLRFKDLGYSNYTADEYGALIWTKTTEGKLPDDTLEFLMSRKKGPLQYLVTAVPVYLTGEFNNEFAVRVPFALFSTLSVGVFYLLVKRFTKRRLAGFVAAALLMTNGFISAFGRIAQYQNLNLFFSFAALYMYSELMFSKKNLLRKSLLGTFFVFLSLLAHWDVIYIAFPLFYIFFKFFENKNFKPRFKKKLILTNVVFGLVLAGTFLVPYSINFFSNETNQEYIFRRFGSYSRSNTDGYGADISFYAPYLALLVYTVGGLVGALFLRKNRIFLGWFLFNFLFFELLVKRPGTHIYNFLIPTFALGAVFASELVRKSFRYLKVGPVLLIFGILGFLYYQSYLIFVDHQVEYPWEQEMILEYKTPGRNHENRVRYIIGFPHNRYWEEINDFINEQNEINDEDFGFMSNESKTISEYYMDAKYKTSEGFYAVGIKRPWSFSNDHKFPQIRGKHTVKRIENEYGVTVVNIYRVNGE